MAAARAARFGAALGRGARLALLGVLSGACSDGLYVGSELVWTARHESADFSEWTQASAGAVEVDDADGALLVTDARAHTGKYSALLQKLPTGSTANGSGPRLMRFGGLPAHAFYSAWLLVPRAYTTGSYWTILQFDSARSTSPVEDRGVDLQLRSLPNDELVLQVFFHNAAYLGAPLAEPAPIVTPGSWFHLEAEFTAATDASGALRVWLDGRKIYDISGRPTTDPASLEFMLASMLVSAAPSPVELYVDDVAISRTRVTPEGVLSR